MGHVEDVGDVVEGEVVSVLGSKLVANVDVGPGPVHPGLLPAEVGLHFGPHQLVALLGRVGLQSNTKELVLIT